MLYLRSLTVGDVTLNSLGKVLRPGKWVEVEKITDEIRQLISNRTIVMSRELPKTMAGRVQELINIQAGDRAGAKRIARVPQMVSEPVDRPLQVDMREQHPQRSDGAHLPKEVKVEIPKEVPVVPSTRPQVVMPEPVVKSAPVGSEKPIPGLAKDSKGRYAAGSIGGW